jgi:hypothetical protein
VLWEDLSAADQDRWLTYARAVTPRRDVFLKSLLPAAEQMCADLRAIDP